jgi:ABC-2 type transporter
VQFAIFGLVSSAQILVQECKTRALQRLLTTNMKPWEIVPGHPAAMMVVVYLRTALLIAFGQWVLNVNYLREPAGHAAGGRGAGRLGSEHGLLIGAVAKDEHAVILFWLIAMFPFSGLGGAWLPLESSGRTFATIGHLITAAWAMDGCQTILVRGLSLPSVWLPAAVLLAYAAVYFSLAEWCLKFEGGAELKSAARRWVSGALTDPLWMTLERRLRRGQPRNGHAERRATDVVQAGLVEERHRARVAAVLAAHARLHAGPG